MGRTDTCEPRATVTPAPPLRLPACDRQAGPQPSWTLTADTLHTLGKDQTGSHWFLWTQRTSCITPIKAWILSPGRPRDASGAPGACPASAPDPLTRSTEDAVSERKGQGHTVSKGPTAHEVQLPGHQRCCQLKRRTHRTDLHTPPLVLLTSVSLSGIFTNTDTLLRTTTLWT